MLFFDKRLTVIALEHAAQHFFPLLKVPAHAAGAEGVILDGTLFFNAHPAIIIKPTSR